MKKRWWEEIIETPDPPYTGQQSPVPGASGWKVWLETIGILIIIGFVLWFLTSL